MHYSHVRHFILFCISLSLSDTNWFASFPSYKIQCKVCATHIDAYGTKSLIKSPLMFMKHQIYSQLQLFMVFTLIKILIICLLLLHALSFFPLLLIVSTTKNGLDLLKRASVVLIVVALVFVVVWGNWVTFCVFYTWIICWDCDSTVIRYVVLTQLSIDVFNKRCVNLTIFIVIII